MKRIISLLMIAAMLFTTMPVFADSTEPVVTLKYVTDGETYEAGSSVILGAETNVAVDVARVDFYANGIKIPGCITSLDKTLSWTVPTAGSFEIYAAITTTGGGESYRSEVITVYGKEAAKEIIVKFDSVSDVSNYAYSAWGANPYTEKNTSEEYVKNSIASAVWDNLSNSDTFAIKNISANRIGDKYLNYLIYSTQDITIWSTLTDSTDPANPKTRPQSSNMAGGFISLKKGWNPLSIEIAKLDKDGYYAVESVIATINRIDFYTAYDATIPSGYGFVNEGIKIKSQPNLADTTIYFDSAWLSSEPIAAPKASSSIPSGSTQVCNELDKITLTFDKEMDFSALSDGDLTVTDDEGVAVENFTLIPSTNALIVDFADNNALVYDKTYTVTLSDNVKSFYGKSVDSTTREFTFSTIQSCETVEPIVSLTYPAASANVAADNVTLAAKVIFGGSVSGVAFYEGDTKLADGIKGADGEWYASIDTLPSGTHSVKVVVTYGDSSSTKETEATSFTVNESLNYTFTGISDGEEITMNTTVQPLVTRTIGITPVNDVSKVVYKIDGVELATVTESPFTWDMPITALNTNVTVSADVYSIGVNAVAPVTYKAVYVDAKSSYRILCTNDFETGAYNKSNNDYSGSITLNTAFPDSATDIFESCTGRGGVYNISYIDATQYNGTGTAVMINKVDDSTVPGSNALLVPYGAAITTKTDITAATANPRVNLAMDFYIPEGTKCTANDEIRLMSKLGINTANVTLCELSEFSQGVWHSLEIYVDTAAKLLTKTIDNVSTVEAIPADFYTLIDGSADGGEKKIAFRVHTFSDLIVDNFWGSRVVPATRNDLFVNGIKKDVTTSGETVNVSVANLSAADSTVSVLFALYNDDNEMIAVWTEENVSVKSNELSQTIQNVPYTVNGKTGTIVKAFCWNNMGEIKPVQTIR